MGSCISKCKPKSKIKQEDCSHVHDKLVISHDPIVSSVPSMEKRLPSEKKTLSPAPSSSSSTASFSSFSCSANSKFTLESSISSSSSYSSSVLLAKDKSFSKDFLLSSMKEYPHVIGLNPMIKEKSATKMIHPQNFELSCPLVSTPKKRARASSPNLVRKKSLRRDHNFSCPTPNRGLRSPSPSRRFKGAENSKSFLMNGTNSESFSRRQSVSRGSSCVNSVSSGSKREIYRGYSGSPNRDVTINRNVPARRKDAYCEQADAKISSVGAGDVEGSKEMDVVMEDINNPLIALDCFIFL